MAITAQSLKARLLPQEADEFDRGQIASAIQAKMASLSNEERATGTANLEVFLDELLAVLIPKLRDSISKAITDELHQNAVVTGPVTVASVSGVTTGPGVSGPGTGTMTSGKIL